MTPRQELERRIRVLRDAALGHLLGTVSVAKVERAWSSLERRHVRRLIREMERAAAERALRARRRKRIEMWSPDERPFEGLRVGP